MTIRKRNLTPREAHDFYRTPRECVDSLLLAEAIDGPVWECACGDGAISTVLRAAGHSVVSTDLMDWGYGERADFLMETRLRAPVILTNPPYLLAEKFLAHALTLQPAKLVLLLRLSWLEGEGRRGRVFTRHPPTRVWVLSSRPTLWHGTAAGARDSGGAISYAWYVWERNRPAETVLGWLERPPVAVGLQATFWRHDLAHKRLAAAIKAACG